MLVSVAVAVMLAVALWAVGLSIVTTTLLVAPIAYGLFKYREYWAQFKSMPGPAGLPLVGNLFDLNKPGIKLRETLRQMGTQYGDIFMIRVGFTPFVVLSSQSAVWEALVTQAKNFSDRYAPHRFKMSGDDKSFGFMGICPLVKKMRGLVMNKLRVTDGGSEREGLITAILFAQLAKLRAQDGELTDPKDLLLNITYRSILTLVGGRAESDKINIGTLKRLDEGIKVVTGYSVGNMLTDVVSWLPPLVPSVAQPCYKYKEIRAQTWAPFVEEHIKLRAEQKTKPCLLDSMLDEERDDKWRVGFNRGYTLGATNNIFIGGFASTTCAMTSSLLLLLHHPEVAERLGSDIRVAVDTPCGQEDGELAAPIDPEGRTALGLCHKSKLHLLRATILETLRLVTISPFPGSHVPLEDTTICGKFIPKGTEIMVNLWAVHHDPNFWEDPWMFRPDRFLDDNGEFVDAGHPNRRNVMAFGAGERRCVGENFAMDRVFLVLGNILLNFDLKPDPAGLPSWDPKEFESGLILSPPLFKMRFVKRELGA